MANAEWINPDAVRLLLGSLMGRQIQARPGAPITPSSRTPAAVAEYVNDRGELGGLLFCDLPLAASLGAALSLLPANTVTDAIRANKLPEALAENCREVLNVGARWFNAPTRQHVRFNNAFWNQVGLSAKVGEYARRAHTRLDVVVTVPGYQGGSLSILLAG